MSDTTTIIGNGKIDGLIDYLDMLSAKGRVPSPTITNLKSAVKAVFSKVDEDGWTNIDVRGLDLDDYITRFQNLSMGKYNQASYNTYKGRISRSIEWYLKFLQNPGWMPMMKPGSMKKEKKDASDERAKQPHASLLEIPEGEIVGPTNEIIPSPSAGQNSASKLMSFPFPLQDGTIATLYFPPSISENDFERLQAFIKALIIKTDN